MRGGEGLVEVGSDNWRRGGTCRRQKVMQVSAHVSLLLHPHMELTTVHHDL